MFFFPLPQGYNIHINGLFHCTVRYKQLLNLHEQLVKEMDITLPIFPPKKFFPLTANQQEDRRLGLEKYIQTIGQNAIINNCELLNGFLLNAQQESYGNLSDNEDYEIYLMNGHKITLKISTSENSGLILNKACKYINLPEEYNIYFRLFIVLEIEGGGINIIRRLQDFESPFLTQNNIDYTEIKVVLGKGYWDIGNDILLLKNSIATNLLYIQAVAEVERGWILVPNKLKKCLIEAQEQARQQNYLEIVSPLKYYGYLQFASCYCDYPEPETKVLVAIGKNELSLRIFLTNNDEHEAIFKVTRMRCWRITTLHNGLIDKKNNTNDYSLELSFEYLVARNQLQWITITSQQAILMSVCLQSMIDELLLKHVISPKTTDNNGKTWTYIMRDGHSRIMIRQSGTTEIHDKAQKNNNETSKSEAVIKKISDKFIGVKNKKTINTKMTFRVDRASTSNCDIMENNAFHMIGDEDL